jgi:hypothetical protein
MNLTIQFKKRERKVIREDRDVHQCGPPPYLEEEEEEKLQDLLSQISEIV